MTQQAIRPQRRLLPLTAAVLSLAEIKQMTNELFSQHKDYLPQFQVHQV